MKKWLLVLLLLPCAVGAGDLECTIEYTVVAADTGIGSSIIDTAYSDWIRCNDYRWLQFAVALTTSSDGLMFDFTADSFHINVQTSYDKTNIVSTIAVDTLLAAGYGNSIANIDKDATVFGTWMRVQALYKDSVLASIDTALDSSYAATVKVYNLSK